jgi:protein phosphatase
VTLRLIAGGSTDVGRTRQVNQDAFLILEDLGLYVVADGMGGHQGGEVASQLAVSAIRATYADGSDDALVDAIEEANLQIHERGEADPDLRGMGTTLVAVAVVPGDEGGGERLLVANVGDSRAYLFRDGGLTQLTEDHSMVADLVREGRITEDEARVHPQRNIVTRVLGVYDQVDIDLWPVDPVRGDRLLLCSDGLFNEVGADQISAVLRRLAEPQEAADELVRRALEGGGRDNITVVVVDVVDDDGVAEAASATVAGLPSRLDADASDLAGFATAGDAPVVAPEARSDGATGDDAAPATRGRRGRRRREGTRDPLRQRITWRVVTFTVVLLVVVGGAFATIQWYGTHAWYVDFQGEQVTIFKGRPGGLLWIDAKPTDVDTHLTRQDLVDASRTDVASQHESSSLEKAKAYVRTLRTTTTTTSTTTTLPPDPNATTTTVTTP